MIGLNFIFNHTTIPDLFLINSSVIYKLFFIFFQLENPIEPKTLRYMLVVIIWSYSLNNVRLNTLPFLSSIMYPSQLSYLIFSSLFIHSMINTQTLSYTFILVIVSIVNIFDCMPSQNFLSSNASTVKRIFVQPSVPFHDIPFLI